MTQPATPPSISAIFWDIDGTLMLTEELHFATVTTYCQGQDIVLTEIDNAAMLGKTMPEKWHYLRDQYGITDSREVFRNHCADIYIARLETCELRSEPLKLMHTVADMALPQACVSNGDRRIVEANLERMGITKLLNFALASDSVAQGKPAPDPYLLACEKLDLSPASCLAVEDSPVGVASAAEAGLTVVAWPDATSPFSGNDLARADYVIHTIEEFPLQLLEASQ